MSPQCLSLEHLHSITKYNPSQNENNEKKARQMKTSKLGAFVGGNRGITCFKQTLFRLPFLGGKHNSSCLGTQQLAPW